MQKAGASSGTPVVTWTERLQMEISLEKQELLSNSQ